MKKIFFAGVALGLILSANAVSVGTYTDEYVDASTNNTVKLGDPGYPNGTGDWTIRNDFGLDPTAYLPMNAPSGASVWESDGAVYEDSPMLKTTVANLPYDVYDVWIYWWTIPGDTSEWSIAAGLSETNLQYMAADAGQAFTVTSSATHTPPITISLTDRSADNTGLGRVNPGAHSSRIYRSYLGTVAGTQIDVYIDDVFTKYLHSVTGEWLPLKDAMGNQHGGRTWYDGIGYKAVPEPGTIGAILAGLVGLVGLRKRK